MNSLIKMEYIIILGLVAGALTTISFLPQVLKAWRSKSTKDVSLKMFVILSTGIFLWIVYGIFIRDLPVVVTNVVTFVLAFTILILKIKYK